MANHKSAAKRARQTIKREARNKSTRRSVTTLEKKLRTAIDNKQKKQADELFVTFESKMGKAAQKGMIHPKHAARKIGRLAKSVQAL